MIPEIRLVVCAIAADNGWLEVTDVGLVATDRFECDAIISFARARRAGGVLSISIGLGSLSLAVSGGAAMVARALGSCVALGCWGA